MNLYRRMNESELRGCSALLLLEQLRFVVVYSNYRFEVLFYIIRILIILTNLLLECFNSFHRTEKISTIIRNV